MTKEEAEKMFPIVEAFSKGKQVQIKHKDCTWEDVNELWLDLGYTYRIKPTPTYRPFANAEECWEEMKKHEPFGWVEYRNRNICLVGVGETLYAGTDVTYEDAFNDFTFVDGSVFGKLTEEG